MYTGRAFPFNEAYLYILLHRWHVNHVKLIVSEWNFPIPILGNTSRELPRLLENNETEDNRTTLLPTRPHTPPFPLFFSPPSLKQCVSAQWRQGVQFDIEWNVKGSKSPAVRKSASLCLFQQFPVLPGHRIYCHKKPLNSLFVLTF